MNEKASKQAKKKRKKERLSKQESSSRGVAVLSHQAASVEAACQASWNTNEEAISS